MDATRFLRDAVGPSGPTVVASANDIVGYIQGIADGHKFPAGIAMRTAIEHHKSGNHDKALTSVKGL